MLSLNIEGNLYLERESFRPTKSVCINCSLFYPTWATTSAEIVFTVSIVAISLQFIDALQSEQIPLNLMHPSIDAILLQFLTLVKILTGESFTKQREPQNVPSKREMREKCKEVK